MYNLMEIWIYFYKQHARANNVRLLGEVIHAQRRMNKPLGISNNFAKEMLYKSQVRIGGAESWYITQKTTLEWNNRDSWNKQNLAF